jgi:hypothetical protein
VDFGTGHADVDASQRPRQVSAANALAERGRRIGRPRACVAAAAAVRRPRHGCLGQQTARCWGPHEGAHSAAGHQNFISFLSAWEPLSNQHHSGERAVGNT